MDYHINKLSDELIFIKWYSTPALGSDTQKQFLADMQRYLDEAHTPLYFISDLRAGHIDDLETLHQLGELTHHQNWGAGVSFSANRATSTMVNVFKRLAKRTNHDDGIYPTLEKALEAFERLKPGVTKGIHWESVIAVTQELH